MQVMGVTGLPGSGKSVVSRVAKSFGIQVIRMGDVIRDEAIKRDADIGDTAIKLRKEYGKYVVAERCVELLKEASSPEDKEIKYLIEGIRSPAEVEIFKKHFGKFKVIAVHSSPKTRFMRVRRRKRSDDSSEFSLFKNRDERELNFGIGNVIATSDFMIINEGPIWKFKNSIRSILKNELKKKEKKKITVNNKISSN
ncbi:nucleoside monophosphate kinase [Methanobacterium sp. ACI-7]|uniref:nucleoside monophosphate kinase n=1 Tax=unclassified Methanobacterium TaxID=2627676 RepID=UPI0039C250AD